MKILHVPTNTGGHPQGLANAERSLGLQSHVVTRKQTYLANSVDEVLWPDGMPFAKQLIVQLQLIRRAVRDFDVIHYNSGQTISAVLLKSRTNDIPIIRRCKLAAARVYGSVLQRMELELLRQAGKPYFVTYQGSDARQADVCLGSQRVTFYKEPEGGIIPGADDHIRAQIRRITAHASKVYALNPDLLHVLPQGSEFLPYASVNLADWTPVWSNDSRPVIVHAPTRRWIKGTTHLVDAVNRLQAEGYDFEFDLIEGVSNAVARTRYERAHLLVDQLFAGWYGGLAVELMALGKPVVSYIRPEDLEFIPEAMRGALPIISAEPATIYETLKSYLSLSLSDWQSLGARSRAFVEAWHDPVKIAKRVQADYEAALMR